MPTFYVSCSKGVENSLAEELLQMGATVKKKTYGGVSCEHPNPHFYYDINLKTRVGFRVFIPFETFEAKSPEVLYKKAKKIRWDRLLNNNQTFSVLAHVKNSEMKNSYYASLKLKDAIADWFRERFGKRPNVDTNNPFLPLNLLIDKNRCTISFDTTGRSLHQRGYRTEKTEAPLMETLASTLIYLSEWDGITPFYDLMCGSGTFGIEAALFANKTVPGLINDSFTFTKWADFDVTYFSHIQSTCEEKEQIENLTPIFASDNDAKAIEIAKNNAKRAGVLEQISYFNKNIFDFSPLTSNGLILLNPPYGERIGEKKKLASFYNRLEQVLRENFRGFRFGILCPEEFSLKQLRMRVGKKYSLYNGNILCQFAIYDIYA